MFTFLEVRRRADTVHLWCVHVRLGYNMHMVYASKVAGNVFKPGRKIDCCDVCKNYSCSTFISTQHEVRLLLRCRV